jgi:hypothetical protein
MDADNKLKAWPPIAQGVAEVSTADIHFDQVDLAAYEAARTCRRCQRPLDDLGEYFEFAGNIVCRACAEDLGGAPGKRGAFPRALVFGTGAAIVGTIVWFAIIKIFRGEFGLIAIGVGLFVGAAVRRGARRCGGWKFQTLAMLLTYLSITTSYVPLLIKGMGEQSADDRPQASARQKSNQPGTGSGLSEDVESLRVEDSARQDESDAVREARSVRAVVAAFLLAFGLAFASPFLGGAGNIMGIIIIGVALYEAWKLNRRVALTGPFRLVAAPPTRSAT